MSEVGAKRKGNNSCKKSVRVDGGSGSSGELSLFFVDTVFESCGAQDTMTTANIIDCLCIRLTREIGSLKEVVLVSDNAPNYVNLTMTLIIYYIFKFHSLRLLEVLHPDAQESKNMVDAHFGIGSRQIGTYIRENDLAVLCPDDIAEALIYNGGVKSTSVDFLKVNLQSKRLKRWFEARDDKKKSNQFDIIGTSGEIKIHEMEDGCVHVVTSMYSVAATKHYCMEECTIIYAGDTEEKFKKSVAKGIPRKASVGGNVQVNTGNVSALNVFGLRHGDANRAEIENIADSIVGGEEHRVGLQGGEVKMSARPEIGIALYTGTLLKFMSTITHWGGSVYLDCKEAFCDTQAEIEADEEGMSGDSAQGSEGNEGTGNASRV